MGDLMGSIALADECAELVAAGPGADDSRVRRHPACAELNLYPDDVAAVLAKSAAVASAAEASA
jgi:hypothetical protein